MQIIGLDTWLYLRYGKYVTFSMSVDFVELSSITLTQDNVMEGTIMLDRNWVSGSVIEIGNAETSELRFFIDNYDRSYDAYTWEGALIVLTIFVDGESIVAGRFIVDEQPKKQTTIEIVALDYMAKFNKQYSLSTLEYPATLGEIYLDACAVCNVSTDVTTFVNSDYIVSVRPTDEEITFHQIIAWVAELSGSNAYIDHLGKACMSWYGENQGAYEIQLTKEDQYPPFDAEESDIEITGIVTTIDGTTYTSGTDDYAFVIEANELLQSDYQTIIDAIFAKVGGLIFRPFNLRTPGYPNLWPGDVVKITDPNNNVFQSVIMKHSYTINGDSTIIAVGETKRINGFASASTFTAKQKAIIAKVAKIEASTQIGDLYQKTIDLNDIISNSMGFYQTRVDDGNGGIIFYMHDSPTLAGSTYIYTMTGSGFAWTDSGWNGGSPIWQYGYTTDGNAVLRVLTLVGLIADWIQAGSLRSANGRIIFDLDDETFTIGDHILDILTGTLKFTSLQRDEVWDYIFKRDAGDKVNVQIDGTIDITEAASWGSVKAEIRTTVGNEGVDFVF